jgi:hypothetical protein
VLPFYCNTWKIGSEKWLILTVLVKIISKWVVCKKFKYYLFPCYISTLQIPVSSPTSQNFMFQGSILRLKLPTELNYKSKSSLNVLPSLVFKTSLHIKLVNKYFKEPNFVPLSPSGVKCKHVSNTVMTKYLKKICTIFQLCFKIYCIAHVPMVTVCQCVTY